MEYQATKTKIKQLSKNSVGKKKSGKQECLDYRLILICFETCFKYFLWTLGRTSALVTRKGKIKGWGRSKREKRDLRFLNYFPFLFEFCLYLLLRKRVLIFNHS